MDIESYILGRKSAGGGGGSDLPVTPSTDGTYTLTNTVSSGTGTLSWGAGDNATLVVVHDVEGQLDKTWQEIFDAVSEGNIVFVSANSEMFASFLPVLAVMDDTGNAGVYSVFVLMADTSTSEMVLAQYIADTANDYPILD